MTDSRHSAGIAPRRLPARELAANFAELYPPFDQHEASVAADRCYFCYDAPCVAACPTEIDIPLFIRQIQADRPDAAARTIFASNILGGMCARVCPTEILCEGACVREMAEAKPVEIGRLQRYATDSLMHANEHPFKRAGETGRRVAIVGAGPAGLACAHGLARHGHDVTIFEARAKPGGLNEYGIAAYKTVDNFAKTEVDWLLQIGGITVETGKHLGEAVDLAALHEEFDAVFLGIGLSGVNALDAEGAERNEVVAAIDFIADLRQAADLSALPVGRDVVVIGGGMTAVDASVQSRLLGAENVTLVYRRGRDRMGASRHEQDHAARSGVRIVTNAQPLRVIGNGAVREVEFEYVLDGPDGLRGTGETFRLKADQVFRAIGQRMHGAPPSLEMAGGKIATTGPGRTSLDRVWAGGDCAAGGDDLTVTAVAQGRDAAEDMHARLSAR